MIKGNDEVWKTWCRTCGNKHNTEFEDDFVKWESIDQDLLENIRKLTNLETLLKHDGIICFDCHAFLKEIQKFSYRCAKIHKMFTEIHLDYQSFGESDLLTVRSRYDLDNEQISFVQMPDATNINDLLKIEIKLEVNHENELNDNTVNDQSMITVGNRERKLDKKKRKELEPVRLLATKSTGETRKQNKIMKLEEVNTEEGILNVNVMIKDDLLKNDDPTDVFKIGDYEIVKKEKYNNKRGPKQKTCSMCSLNFENSALYEAHLKANHTKDEWPMVCEHCTKRFTSMRNLKLHELVHLTKHSGPDPYICEQCGKACLSNSALRDHQVVHSDEHPFECDSCSRRFKNLYQLKIHKKIHVGILFDCSICQRQFNTQRTLKQHMVVHSEQKKYKCNYCGNEYKRSKTLKTHLILHTGQRPYKCPFCDKTFVNGSNCRSHKKKAHPIELAEMEATGEVHITNLPKLRELQPK